MSNQKETLRQTQDAMEGLYLLVDLGTSWHPPKKSWRRGRGKGTLKLSSLEWSWQWGFNKGQCEKNVWRAGHWLQSWKARCMPWKVSFSSVCKAPSALSISGAGTKDQSHQKLYWGSWKSVQVVLDAERRSLGTSYVLIMWHLLIPMDLLSRPCGLINQSWVSNSP